MACPYYIFIWKSCFYISKLSLNKRLYFSSEVRQEILMLFNIILYETIHSPSVRVIWKPNLLLIYKVGQKYKVPNGLYPKDKDLEIKWSTLTSRSNPTTEWKICYFFLVLFLYVPKNKFERIITISQSRKVKNYKELLFPTLYNCII